VADLAGGTYYYHPVEHALYALSAEGEFDERVYDPLVNGPIARQAAFALYLVADQGAIAPLYGAQARDFCLLEAGAMSQLLGLACEEQGIGLCPLGAVEFSWIRDLFALEERHELVHALLGGPLDQSGAGSSAPADGLYLPLARNVADDREEGEI
jgi:SagB-type dehydrogenase family enzyme